MKRVVNPIRMLTIIVMIAALLTIYGSALYDLQIIHGDDYVDEKVGLKTTSYTVEAARGNILDRNGVLLVSSETVYSVGIDYDELRASGRTNETLLRLAYSALESGVKYTDTFPVTKSAPFSYVADMTDTQRSRLDAYMDYFGLDKDISAQELMLWFKDHYGIDYTTGLSDVRLIVGIRYELELRLIVNASSYVFASGVTTEFVSHLLEDDYPGIMVSTSSQRVYHTEYAAHLLGYTGKMNEAEYEKYKERGYGFDETVGKSGVELAFEEYLHGTRGTVQKTTNQAGNTVDSVETKQAVAGSNIYLSIDIEMQAIAEEALADTIGAINATREEGEETAEGGAVVVMDVRTGETYASASYPTFDLESFYSNYSLLREDPANPLFNRAMQGTYNPGSTFKMVTAYAALSTETITTSTRIEDKGIYDVYESYKPRCWIHPRNHGRLNVIGALENSCNYFFYTVGDTMGIKPIANTAAMFGLGQKTGIELYEEMGAVASEQYKITEIGEGWYSADTLLASIGQGYNMFTPIQLANYVSTIANGGTLNRATVLKSVLSYDYSEVVKQSERDIISTINDEYGYLPVLRQGMEAVVETGTAASSFKDYPIKVAAKTGTVQSDTASKNTGVFVCYAPADNPEIAIAVVVEKGGSGSAIISVARTILDYYFAVGDYGEAVQENTIIR